MRIRNTVGSLVVLSLERESSMRVLGIYKSYLQLNTPQQMRIECLRSCFDRLGSLCIGERILNVF